MKIEPVYIPTIQEQVEIKLGHRFDETPEGMYDKVTGIVITGSDLFEKFKNNQMSVVNFDPRYNEKEIFTEFFHLYQNFKVQLRIAPNMTFALNKQVYTVASRKTKIDRVERFKDLKNDLGENFLFYLYRIGHYYLQNLGPIIGNEEPTIIYRYAKVPI